MLMENGNDIFITNNTFTENLARSFDKDTADKHFQILQERLE